MKILTALVRAITNLLRLTQSRKRAAPGRRR